MTLFVYRTAQCHQDAETYGVQDHIDDLTQRITQSQALWGLSAFVHPFWVKKRLGNRHTRLICRIESHKINEEMHDVLVLMRIMQRSDHHYTELFLNIKQNGELMYQEHVQHSVLMTWLKQQVMSPAVQQKPALSEAESSVLYGVRNQFQHTEQQHQQEMVYDSWTWFEKSPVILNEQDWHEVATRLGDAVSDATQDGLHDLGQYAGYRACFYYSLQYRFGYLSLEAECESVVLSDRHVSMSALMDLVAHQSSDQIKQKICQAARRAYPMACLFDEQQWLSIQYDSAANLALSPEEAHVLSQTRQQERPFPLFINGRAGSGKSTVLQYLFADYVYFQIQKQQSAPLIYFSCNRTLVDRASRTIHQVLQHSCRYESFVDLISLEQVQQSCAAFQDYLLNLLPEEQRQAFAPSRWVGYGRFRRLWQDKFGLMPAHRQHSADLCWHVIRSLIKGLNNDDWMDHEDYLELHENERQIDDAIFADIEKRVWSDWYLPLCKSEGYWDDQDLARAVLESDVVQPTFTAIFCDEAQDFTPLELQIILRLSVYSNRQLQPHEIQRVPLVFAGDQFQTLNPTGFRWDAFKAQVMEQFVFALDPAKHSQHNEMNYQELSFNFRSSHRIAQFSNVVHGLRASRLALTHLSPQQSWHHSPASRDVVFVDYAETLMIQQLQQQRDLVVILPCHDGQEMDYIEQDQFLKQWLAPTAQGTTFVPVLSVITAKGLEFERVVMYGFAKIRPPKALWKPQKAEDQQQIAVEYYLNKLYVAVTRARSQLFVLDGQADYVAFWQPFTQPLLEPLALRQLDREGVNWSQHLGALRLARLDDLTPDADQIVNMQLNAEQFAAQGRELEDARLLKQAAGLYEQLGLLPEQQHCLADALVMESAYAEAAALYEKIGRWSEAFTQYWRAGEWYQMQESIAQQPALAERPEAGLSKLLWRDSLSLPMLIECLQQLQMAGLQRPIEVVDQCAWQLALAALLPKIPVDADQARWSQLLTTLRWLKDQDWLADQVSNSILAQVAFWAEDMQQACYYWDQAKQHDRVTPPRPAYQQAMIQAVPFPDNISAMLELDQKKEVAALFIEYPAVEQLSVEVWSQVLPVFRSNLANHYNSIQQYLLTINRLEILDELVKEVAKLRPKSRWLNEANQVRSFKAAQQLHWPSILMVLSTTTNPDIMLKKLRSAMLSKTAKARQKRPLAQLSSEQWLVIKALSLSDQLVVQAQERHDSDDIVQLMDSLKQHFTIQHKTITRQHKSYQEGIEVIWQVDSQQVRWVGAVLERCNHFMEALAFYKQLNKDEEHKDYAAERWLITKYRQAKHYERMQADFEAKAKGAVELKRRTDYQDKAREMKGRTERAYAAAEEHRDRIKIMPDSVNQLPEYPVLFDPAQILQEVLALHVIAAASEADQTTQPATNNEPLQAIDLTATEQAAAPDMVSDDQSHAVAQMDASATSDQAPCELVDQPIVETPLMLIEDATTEAASDFTEPNPLASVEPAKDQLLVDQPEIQLNIDQVALEPSLPSINATPIQPLSLVDDVVIEEQPLDMPVTVASVNLSETNSTSLDDKFESQSTRSVEQANPVLPNTAINMNLLAVRLPRTELMIMDYRVVLVRQTRRLNIEHQLTGEQISIRLDQRQGAGDWQLRHDHAECWLLHGTPWHLEFNADQLGCTLHWPAYGIALLLTV